MTKKLVLLLLIGHFLADYYFQTDYFVRKQTMIKVLIHGLVYFITLVLSILPVFNWSLFIIAFVIGLIHLGIDLLKYTIHEKYEIKYSQSVTIYLIDQMLHYITIGVAGIYIVLNQVPINYIPSFQIFLQSFPVNINNILSWVLIILIVYKPSSITIRRILDNFSPDNNTEDVGVKNAGALIGIFERLIILMMLAANQYAAIGFVLTAKSIARYNRISEDPQFAEYYLLGTLLSSLLVIISYHLIFH